MKRLFFILLACAAFAGCGTAASQSTTAKEDTSSKAKVSVKRVSVGERYVLTDADKSDYLSLEEFYRKRCSKPRASSTSSVNSSSGEILVKIDGSNGSLDAISILDVYSIRVLEESQTASYGFSAAGGVIEIETVGHHESMTGKKGSLLK